MECPFCGYIMLNGRCEEPNCFPPEPVTMTPDELDQYLRDHQFHVLADDIKAGRVDDNGNLIVSPGAFMPSISVEMPTDQTLADLWLAADRVDQTTQDRGAMDVISPQNFLLTPRRNYDHYGFRVVYGVAVAVVDGTGYVYQDNELALDYWTIDVYCADCAVQLARDIAAVNIAKAGAGKGFRPITDPRVFVVRREADGELPAAGHKILCSNCLDELYSPQEGMQWEPQPDDRTTS